MENASKALIMAGAILLAMLLIALGIRVFNGARNSADETVLDSAEITMFNQKFERFAGKSISGSNVKSLCSFAISNASTNKEEPRKLPEVILYKSLYEVSVSADPDNTDYVNKLGTMRTKIKSAKSYEVNLQYNNSSGLIDSIKINFE